MSRADSPILTPRQITFATLAVLAAVLVHLPHLPFAISAFVLAMVALGWARHRRRGATFPNWIKLGLIAMFVVVLIAQYGSMLGREPGSALVCAMLGLKLLETRTRRDALAVVSFASFALMSALLFDTSLLFTLATFAGVALLLATLRELEPQPAVAAPPKPVIRTYWPPLRASLASLAVAAPLALCGFLFIPRLDSPFWRTPGDTSARTGISDTMSPGSVQELLIDDSAAFRVGFDGAPPPRAQLYWRGPVLTDFDGTTWRRRDPGNSNGNSREPSMSADTIGYEVTLEASGKPWLFALDLPVDAPPEASRSRDMSLVRGRPVTELLRYRMRSALNYRLDPTLSPTTRAAALALPEGFNSRSIEQGKAWRSQFHNDDAIVRAALDLFHNAFFYTLAAPPLGRDSVDDFLFDKKRGFCEHFAAAFVVLMRAAGIPARVVTGYQGGYFNKVGNYLLVRQSDAHAWAEVWFEDRGWTRVDPTAAVSPQRVEFGAQAASLGERAWYQSDWLLTLRNQFDLINRGWNNLVVQFNTQRQQSLLNPFGIDHVEQTTLIWLLLGTTSVLLAVTALWAMRTSRRRTAPLDVAYDALCGKLSRFLPARGSNEGPLDYAARLRTAQTLSDSCMDQVQNLIADYVGLRYGRAFPTAEGIADFARNVRKMTLEPRG